MHQVSDHVLYIAYVVMAGTLMTRWLLKFTNLSVLDQANHGETPIHVASALGHYDSVKVCYIMYIYIQIVIVTVQAMIGACDRGAKDSLCIIQDKTGIDVLL